MLMNREEFDRVVEKVGERFKNLRSTNYDVCILSSCWNREKSIGTITIQKDYNQEVWTGGQDYSTIEYTLSVLSDGSVVDFRQYKSIDDYLNTLYEANQK